jgi:alkylhydroperoxidase/carboxymuconolactone decarboxylase family protein YurZ
MPAQPWPPATGSGPPAAFSPPSPAASPTLEVHINAALNAGLTSAQITEALLHSAVYCGMPRALNATFVAKTSSPKRDLLPVDDTTT